jgi:hypothetical protein
MRIKPHTLAGASARKLLAAAFALAIALSAAPPTPAQTGRNGQPVKGINKQGEVRTGRQTTTDEPRIAALRVLREHIPPILFEDGSLTVRADRFDVKEPSGNANRPHRYRRNNYNDLTRVVVTAFAENGIPHYYVWDTRGASSRIRIFLERWDSASNTYVPVNGEEPQIEVRDRHEIEISQDMLDGEDCQPVPGSILECKFEHPGFGAAHFRIRDVRVHKGNSPNYEYPVWPANRLQVMIQFYYDHPHRK